MVKRDRLDRLRAISFGRNRSSAALLRTTSRVAALSWPLPFKAFETVPTLTPAALATS
jgi:hypothetical protein